MSARRLYDLNRRATYSRNLKNHASRSQTAHDLLVRSYRNAPGRKIESTPEAILFDLRQVTAEDENSQNSRSTDFVTSSMPASSFSAGGAPRTKTKDSDPDPAVYSELSKDLWLAAFIGLADRDRFELSGDDLEQVAKIGRGRRQRSCCAIRSTTKLTKPAPWAAANPARNRSRYSGTACCNSRAGTSFPSAGRRQGKPICSAHSESDTKSPDQKAWADKVSVSIRKPRERAHTPGEFGPVGLGFEDRTLGVEQIPLGSLHPQTVYAIGIYRWKGRSGYPQCVEQIRGQR